MVSLVLAAAQSQVGPFAAVLGFGLAIGVLGHLSNSRTLILTGILIIGLVSVYFAFVAQPS